MKPAIPITVLAAALVGCSDAASPSIAPNVTAQQQASASRSMGLAFPRETCFLLYNRASDEPGLLPAPDDAVHLKIELPASALANLLAQSPLSSAKWTAAEPCVHDMPKWPEWQPSKVKKFRSKQFQLQHAQDLNVLIDDDHDDTKVVYLYWFET